MKYLMLIKHAESYRNEEIPPALMEAMGGFIQELSEAGSLVETAGLKPTKDGARIRLSGGKMKTTDGPFSEAKEVIGGFAIIDARSHTHAMELATRFMDLHRVHWPAFEGESEVRPFEEMG